VAVVSTAPRTFLVAAVAALAVAAPAAQGATLAPEAGRPAFVAGVTDFPASAPVRAAAPGAAPGSFGWGDAGIGAGATLLIVLALVGSVRFTNLTSSAQDSLRTG
jgi:hypothetical protein